MTEAKSGFRPWKEVRDDIDWDKRRLVDIVDNLEYARTNCYQGQLGRQLDEDFDVMRLSLDRIGELPYHSKVVIRLRLRTLVRELATVARAIQATQSQCVIYEQDCWENFMCDGQFQGSYQRVDGVLDPVAWLTMSEFWAKEVTKLKISCWGVRVWVRPEHISAHPKAFSERKHDVAFWGAMYPHREQFFKDLAGAGLKVAILSGGLTYEQHLQRLNDTKVLVRSERHGWRVRLAGKLEPEIMELPNAQWQRDVEAAAQGCFSVRELDSGYQSWGLNRFPLVQPVLTDPERSVASIRDLLQTSDADHRRMCEDSYMEFKKDIGWGNVTSAIRGQLFRHEDVYDHSEYTH